MRGIEFMKRILSILSVMFLTLFNSFAFADGYAVNMTGVDNNSNISLVNSDGSVDDVNSDRSLDVDDSTLVENVSVASANNFDLNDLLEQMKAVKKLGPIKNLLKMIPGINKIDLSQADPEDELKKVSAIICSMTKQERENPDIMDASRKRRIANGCKRSVNEINLLLKRFEEMKKMVQMLKNKKFNLFGN